VAIPGSSQLHDGGLSHTLESGEPTLTLPRGAQRFILRTKDLGDDRDKQEHDRHDQRDVDDKRNEHAYDDGDSSKRATVYFAMASSVAPQAFPFTA
jgi:hypothetical protein